MAHFGLALCLLVHGPSSPLLESANHSFQCQPANWFILPPTRLSLPCRNEAISPRRRLPVRAPPGSLLEEVQCCPRGAGARGVVGQLPLCQSHPHVDTAEPWRWCETPVKATTPLAHPRVTCHYWRQSLSAPDCIPPMTWHSQMFQSVSISGVGASCALGRGTLIPLLMSMSEAFSVSLIL